MPVSGASFTNVDNPVSKLQKLMKVLGKGSIEAFFTDDRGEKTLSREYIEMAFQDYAISQQNPQVMNKWISLDTKLDKNLLEYLSDVKMLIASVAQTGAAQQSATDTGSTAAPNEGMGSESMGTGLDTHDRELPVSREK